MQKNSTIIARKTPADFIVSGLLFWEDFDRRNSQMPYVQFNPNPYNQRVGDCVVRALCKALDKEWEDAYISLCAEGLTYFDMPSSNYVWAMYLRKHGYEQKAIPSFCPACTTVRRFAAEHRRGKYVLACQSHVVTVEDGDYYDTWDSGNEIVLYYFEREA